MVEQFLGKWTVPSSENMKALRVNPEENGLIRQTQLGGQRGRQRHHHNEE